MTQPERDTREREVIVTERSGGGPGMIIGVILAIAALALVIWLLLGMGGDDGGAALSLIHI